MPLKVLSYNVGAHSEVRLASIIAAVREHDPDVVALLDPKARSLVEKFAGALGMSAHYGEGNHGWGVAWLSRLRVEDAENHPLPPMFHTLLRIKALWTDLPSTFLRPTSEV